MTYKTGGTFGKSCSVCDYIWIAGPSLGLGLRLEKERWLVYAVVVRCRTVDSRGRQSCQVHQRRDLNRPDERIYQSLHERRTQLAGCQSGKVVRRCHRTRLA